MSAGFQQAQSRVHLCGEADGVQQVRVAPAELLEVLGAAQRQLAAQVALDDLVPRDEIQVHERTFGRFGNAAGRARIHVIITIAVSCMAGARCAGSGSQFENLRAGDPRMLLKRRLNKLPVSAACILYPLVAGLASAAMAASPQGDVAVTIYSSARPGAIPPDLYRPLPGRAVPDASAVPGYAMVKQERLLKLEAGHSTLRYSDVATIEITVLFNAYSGLS